MKEGDKLICKKEFHTGGIIFFKDNEYEVLYVQKNSSLLRIGSNFGYYYFSYDNIPYYFYSNQELRKKKLEKLRNDKNMYM